MKPIDHAAAWRDIKSWQDAEEFRHAVLSTQDGYAFDLYDAGTRRQVGPKKTIDEALEEAAALCRAGLNL